MDDLSKELNDNNDLVRLRALEKLGEISDTNQW